MVIRPFHIVRCLALCLRRLQVFARFFTGGFYFDDTVGWDLFKKKKNSYINSRKIVEHKIVVVVAHVWFNNCIS
jgi:hypothetical protein